MNPGILLRLIFPIVRSVLSKLNKYRTYYDIIWKRASALKPHEIMHHRAAVEYGFNPFYQYRDVDRQIEQKIRNNENLLVIGHPLAGKTRAIYQALKGLRRGFFVLIPKITDVRPDDFNIPWFFKGSARRMVLLDDIDKFAVKQIFEYQLLEFIKRGDTIIGTCRSGDEYDVLCKKMESQLQVFGDPIRIEKVTSETAKQVAEKAGVEVPDTFDGNIGSVFVPLNTMVQRYRECDSEEKGILRSVRRLYEAGVYEGREIFDQMRVRLVSEECEGIRKKEHEWRGLIDGLVRQGFLERVDGDFTVEETYLQTIIGKDFEIFENFRKVLDILDADPSAMFKLADRADDLGKYSLQKARYEEIAIVAYEKALNTYNLEKSPTQFARTQNNLGIAYRGLSEVEDKAANCWKAIMAYEEALKVYTLDAFPMDYAMTQNNLGAACQALAEVEDKAANCRKAITAFQEALKVRTLDAFPIQYAMTQNNLGTAYGRLAEVEDKAANCRKAITAFEETLKIYTFNVFPIQYGVTQNNLGGAFGTLAQVEDRAVNCRKAITAFQEALKARSPDAFSLQHAETQYNLAAAYGILSEVENKKENCMKAKEAFDIALEIFDKEGLHDHRQRTINGLAWLYKICGDKFSADE
jgi:tetratricopeptide (TPR) repeat protein